MLHKLLLRALKINCHIYKCKIYCVFIMYTINKFIQLIKLIIQDTMTYKKIYTKMIKYTIISFYLY